MSSGSEPLSQPVRRRRRRRKQEPTGWKAIPNVAKLLIATCLLVMIVVPVAIQQSLVALRAIDKSALPLATPSSLVIAEASLDLATRTIVGSVKNTSKSSFKDVQVSYNIRDAAGREIGTTLATIAGVGPNEIARFRTDPLPENGREFVLREVAGTAR